MDAKKILMLLKGFADTMAPQFKDPNSTHSIKETKEALDGALMLGLVLAERLKDGVGLDDLGALWDKWKNDPVVQEKLKAAVDGYENIDEEVGDLDTGEGLELGSVAIDYVPKYMDALKKEAFGEDSAS